MREFKTLPKLPLIGSMLVLLSAILLLGISLAFTDDAYASVNYVAHKGRISSSQAENSIRTFKTAASTKGVYGIETDVWRTADGKYVCIHGTGGVSANWGGYEVTQTNYATLKSVRPNGQKICSLARFLQICKSGGKKAVLELKDKRLSAVPGYATRVVDICQEQGMLGSTIFISYQAIACKFSKDHAKGRYGTSVRTYALGNDSGPSVQRAVNEARAYGLTGVDVHRNQVGFAHAIKGSLKLAAWIYPSKRLAASDGTRFGLDFVTGEYRP